MQYCLRRKDAAEHGSSGLSPLPSAINSAFLVQFSTLYPTGVDQAGGIIDGDNVCYSTTYLVPLEPKIDNATSCNSALNSYIQNREPAKI